MDGCFCYMRVDILIRSQEAKGSYDDDDDDDGVYNIITMRVIY